jgi:hypothetical protein
MRIRQEVLLVIAALSAACWPARWSPAAGPAQASPAGSAVALSAELIDDRLVVRLGSDTVTCYRFGQGQKYPYFYPVVGPVSGQPLTTESTLPYPHHRSLFFGCDRVNGGNYWQEGNERGQILSQRPVITEGGPEAVEFTDRCLWKQPGQEPVIEERRVVRITAPGPRLRLLDFDTVLTALVPITIEKTNHSLFAARMRPELSVQAGGVLINAAGARDEKETQGVASPWADYWGRMNGVAEGLAIFDSPRNPWYPSKWFTRDYGFFSPTPFNWLESNLTMKAGEKMPLAYRVVIHADDTGGAGISALYSRWAEQQRR